MSKNKQEERLEEIVKVGQALIAPEDDWLANLANISALLFQELAKINWVGFYLMKEEELVLGPFQGKPACVRIKIGSGVCGTAVAEKASQLVADVHQFPGHIACDAASRSELVIPIIINNKVLGVLDIDSPEVGRFSEIEQKYMEKLVEMLIEETNFSEVEYFANK